MRRPLSIAATAAVLAAGTLGALTPRTAAGAGPQGPPLTTAVSTLSGAVSCPATYRGAHNPVLLVHGTAGTPDATWSWNYLKTLSGMGYDVCTVALADFARADIQVSAERVVYAIRTAAEGSQRKVDVIGFSQGPLEPRWAIKYWPDVQASVGRMISLAGVNHGWTQTEARCSSECTPVEWQMRPDSKFLAALNSGSEAPGNINYTSIYSSTDPFVWVSGGRKDPWAESADIQGASNISIQDICPGRDVEHFQALFDAVYFAVVMDTLTHSVGDAGRVDKSVCTQDAMPGVDPVDARSRTAGLYQDFNKREGEHHVKSEPALAGYARG
jgi:triacylglycerol lipase